LISERYLYVPSLAVALLLGFILAKWNSKAITYAAWAVAAVFAVMTVMRNRDWQDSEKLYTETLAHDPENAYFHLNLAEIILKRGDDAGAREHLTKAADVLAAGKYTFQAYETYRAFVGLGAIEARKQNYPQARTYLEKARAAHPQGEWPYLYLGGIAMEADNNIPLAIDYLNKAIQLGPINEVARDYMGIALFNAGRLPEAMAQFQEALRIDPTYRPAQEHVQMVRQQQQAAPQ
jgi:tetratricopeptide (TPR) repeat protein